MDLTIERELVERAKDNRDAFARLYDVYYPKIFSYVLWRTGSVQAAQDLTSEVFFAALKGIPKYRFQGVPFSAWLYRIANNKASTYLTRSSHKQVNLDDVPEIDLGSYPSPEEELLSAESELKRRTQYLALHKHILRLDHKYQEVITLRFFEDKQINEISVILGKREGTVKSLLHRALKKLREFME